VIIPFFNSAPFIEDALRSVAAQSYQDLEVIMVDDGSADNSLAVARGALRRLGLRGRVVTRPQSVKKGAGASRNFAASLARGQTLAFLDSDDVWLSHHLQRALSALDKHGLDVGAYCAMASTFADGGGRLGLSPEAGFPATGPQDARPILLKGMIVPPNLCVRKTLFMEVGGYNEELACYEDWWLVLQLSAVTRFFFDPAVGSMVRVRLSSLSRQIAARGELAMSSAMYRDQFGLYSAIRKNGTFSEKDVVALRRYVEAWNARQISDLVCAGRFSEANRIVSALREAPSDTRGLLASVLSKVSADILVRTSRKSLKLFRLHS
jgi:glycosyltransferase involved in cell wall biosynthesis